MKRFLLNHLGNWNSRNKFEFSLKKQIFVAFSYTAFSIPFILMAIVDTVNDAMFNSTLIYYGTLAPIYGALYLKGKSTDNETDGDS